MYGIKNVTFTARLRNTNKALTTSNFKISGKSKQSDQCKDFKRPTPRHIIVKNWSPSEPIVCL